MTYDKEKLQKIIILLADNANPRLSPKFGNFANQAQALLSKTQPPAISYEYVIYDIINDLEAYPTHEELISGDVKAIYITGSRRDSFDDSQPWIVKLIQFLEDVTLNAEYEKIKLVAICFGHQVICRALGVETGRNGGIWEVGITEINANVEEIPLLDKYFGTAHSRSNNNTTTESSEDYDNPYQYSNKKGKFNIVEHHQDIAYSLPPSYLNIGSTETCKLQGIYKMGKVISFQGHPEFSTDCSNILASGLHQSGKVSDELYNDIVKRNKVDRNHGLVLGRLIHDFLLEYMLFKIHIIIRKQIISRSIAIS